jgi:hypothetical protein
VVRREPRCYDQPQTRWTLDAIQEVCDWLQTSSRGSLSHLLDRLGISWKGGRSHLHSPDPAYVGKLLVVRSLVAEARRSAGAIVTLFLDEFTLLRQPSLAAAWEQRGARVQPLAEWSCHSNTSSRILAALNAVDGQVHARRRRRIDSAALVGLYGELCASYPQAERLYVVQDNWPQHFHPDVLVALEPQESPWPRYRARWWPSEPRAEAVRRWGQRQLPIQLVPLPTYASWTNPIEKLWRKLSQEVLHLHPFAERLAELYDTVERFLAQFTPGSDAAAALLRYVGLFVPK